ncbi:hypothetical protein [Cohnella mopanensis]|uniref:hypothetical protein n=1 Tax=Cohnella mopanensis TaxID=2911966 RepID=UPI001EF89900|nr:hypothetical protein [Cohnella mopanensis]
MGERAILAYFKTPWEAEKAVGELKKLRIAESKIDRFTGYPGEGVDYRLNLMRGDFNSLAYLTMGGDFDDKDEATLVAASVSASGFSSGGADNRVNGYDILLTAVVDEADYEQALQIVQRLGAMQ